MLAHSTHSFIYVINALKLKKKLVDFSFYLRIAKNAKCKFFKIMIKTTFHLGTAYNNYYFLYK